MRLGTVKNRRFFESVWQRKRWSFPRKGEKNKPERGILCTGCRDGSRWLVASGYFFQRAFLWDGGFTWFVSTLEPSPAGDWYNEPPSGERVPQIGMPSPSPEPFGRHHVPARWRCHLPCLPHIHLVCTPSCERCR